MPRPGITQTPPQNIVIAESPQKLSGSSTSSSSLKLNSWVGLIDEYFEDGSNNNAPKCQEIATHNNVDLSVTGKYKTPLSESEERKGPTVADHSGKLPGQLTSGSAPKPLVLDNTPEETPPIVKQTRPSDRPRQIVGPPQLYGERRYVDKAEETETLPRPEIDSETPTAFSCWSHSDFLNPLTNSSQRQKLVAETTLTWSTNSTPTGTAHSIS